MYVGAVGDIFHAGSDSIRNQSQKSETDLLPNEELVLMKKVHTLKTVNKLWL